jgi:Mg-chelatase subunit ChlD
VIFFDTEQKKPTESLETEELKGRLSKGNQILNSLLEEKEDVITSARLIGSAQNQGISSFSANISEQLIKNFSIAKNIYGKTLIRELTGYNIPDIEKNIKIPEFQKLLSSNIKNKIDELKEQSVISNEGDINETGKLLSAILLFKEELDKLIPQGLLGENINKEVFFYGDKDEIKDYKKGERYRNIAIKSSAKTAIRRGHKNFLVEDLKVFQRKSKGSIYIIYALDASASMRGDKIGLCKKAGIALAYKAITSNDKVGLIVFSSDIKNTVEPTNNFQRLLLGISSIKASKETNLPLTINKAVELFPGQNVTNHLILLTDAMPTVGIMPEKETLSAVSNARSKGITISVIGILLNEKAKRLAEEIVKIGEGRFYIVKELENLDLVVLEDYYSLL